MQRAIIRRFGDPAQVVELTDTAMPIPGPGEALVQMIARPINPADLLLASGRHLVQPDLPAGIGIEGAGRILALGEGVETLEVGRAVAVPFGGTWCDAMLVPARDLVTLPDDVDMRQASMLCVNPLTALLLLEGLQPGDWFIQDAAGSALGRLVTRMAEQRGLRCIAVVRNDRHVPTLRRLGAHAVLVDGEDLPERVRMASDGAPIRRALDAVAGETAHRMLRCVADGGDLICYGLLSSDKVELPAVDLVFRDVTVRGLSRLRAVRSLPPSRLEELWTELTSLLAAGELDVPIERVYPLAHVREALLHVQRADRTGKIILFDPS